MGSATSVTDSQLQSAPRDIASFRMRKAIGRLFRCLLAPMSALANG